MRVFVGIILILSLSLQGRPAFGDHFYVSPRGLDDLAEGNGRTPERPFRTLQFAADQTGPGDTVFVLDGVYRNRQFGKSKTNQRPVLNIKTSGTAAAPVTFRNHPGHRPRIEFDSVHAVYAKGVSHVTIEGLTIVGNAKTITLDDALRHRTRWPPLPYYTTCGISFSEGHHIVVRNCTVSDCCGYGVRFQSCDYMLAEGNEVCRNTAYHPSATCALVVMTPKSMDESDATKIVIRRNVVHDNVNRGH
jgi:hypothetical protein